MKSWQGDFDRRDRTIAGLLWYGTWLACALVAAGVLFNAAAPLAATLGFPWDGYGAMKAGVAVFILLPVARVALMLALFLREGDWLYTAVAAMVLAIIAAGVVIEVWLLD